MRAWLPLLASCYAATPPAGVTCDPTEPACPRGQQCVAGPGGHVCSNGPGVDEPDAPLAGDAMTDGPPSDAPPNAIQKTYNATVAECLDPATPSATACRFINGDTQMVVDSDDSMTGGRWNGYIRFDIDAALAGKTITKVTLRVMATADAKAPGPSTGQIYRTAAFTRQSLDMGAPATMGNALAGSQGAVQANTPVTWLLPSTLVMPSAPVYLAIIANNDDGVNYDNIDGATPPRLIVDAQ